MRVRKRWRRTCIGEEDGDRSIGGGAGATASPRWHTFQA
ncbi:unnamed protein product [Ectocarpus sp. 12 AP-2014]